MSQIPPTGPPPGPRAWPAPIPVPPKSYRGLKIALAITGSVVLLGAIGGALDRDNTNQEHAGQAPSSFDAPSSGWSSVEVDAFVGGCTGSGGDPSDCRCMQSELEAAYPAAGDLVAVQDTSEGDQAMLDAAYACITP